MNEKLTLKMVELFVETAKQYAEWTQGNHVMFLMGSDFHYANARSWFKNLDKIIHYVNLDGRVNTFYSNPIIYTEVSPPSLLILFGSYIIYLCKYDRLCSFSRKNTKKI